VINLTLLKNLSYNNFHCTLSMTITNLSKIMDAADKPRSRSLFPPPCYGMVEDNLYRSAAATSLNFEVSYLYS
jgi:hypothetical protein